MNKLRFLNLTNEDDELEYAKYFTAYDNVIPEYDCPYKGKFPIDMAAWEYKEARKHFMKTLKA